MRAGGCPAVVAQWQNAGGSSQVSWVPLPATASFFTFLYFHLIISKFIYFQCEARCSEQILYSQCLSVANTEYLQVWRGPALPRPSTHSGGSSCIATQHAPPHLPQACAGIAVVGEPGREGEKGSECMVGEKEKTGEKIRKGER